MGFTAKGQALSMLSRTAKGDRGDQSRVFITFYVHCATPGRMCTILCENAGSDRGSRGVGTLIPVIQFGRESMPERENHRAGWRSGNFCAKWNYSKTLIENKYLR